MAKSSTPTEPALTRTSASTVPLLDEELARRAKALQFRAQGIVSSASSGLHKSPHRGASMVFAEHREYRPGDDPRRLDWRAYARSDRPVIRRFEQEARLEALLVLDRSPSMDWAGFEGDGRVDGDAGRTVTPTRKSDYAATLLASCAYLLVGQGDAVAFRALSTGASDALRSSAKRTHMMALFERLSAPCTDSVSTLTSELEAVAEFAPARSLVIVASDFLHGVAEVDGLPLGMLSARGREVVFLHVLHRDEVDPRLDGAARFVGLEQDGEIEADLDDVGDAYREAMQQFRDKLQRQCAASHIRYVSATSDTAPGEVLAHMLRRGRA